jgi:diguanylate cyclase (GGDEF)-like protein
LSVVAITCWWIRNLIKNVGRIASGKEVRRFHFRIREFDMTENALADLSVMLNEIEMEKWSQAARQAGETLNLMFANTTDPLTRVPNRRHLKKLLGKTFGKAEYLSAIMVDIDHFKNVNDTYGHQVGDEVLRHFAGVVKQALRPSDFLARYGGEEFVVLCQATVMQAEAVAERIRKTVEGTKAKTSAGDLKITASFGLAGFRPGDSPETLIGRADEALYRAKQAGRNTVRKEDD